MNDLDEPRSEELGPIVLDRLIDGELDESQRRDLLRSLDHRPDGWRQCALAFLEAQSWGQTLKGLRGQGTGVRGQGGRDRGQENASQREGWLGRSEARPSAEEPGVRLLACPAVETSRTASTAGQPSSGTRQIEPAPALAAGRPSGGGSLRWLAALCWRSPSACTCSTICGCSIQIGPMRSSPTTTGRW